MLTLIAAHDKNLLIGGSNQLLWHLPKDLKRFKKLTSGHPIIMGRKTFESIGRPLPNRTNIVVTRNLKWNFDGVLVATSIADAIDIAQKLHDDIFLIGGGQLYREGIYYCDKLEITEVHEKYQGDTWLCDYRNDFVEVSREALGIDNEHAVGFSFVKYLRIVDQGI